MQRQGKSELSIPSVKVREPSMIIPTVPCHVAALKQLRTSVTDSLPCLRADPQKESLCFSVSVCEQFSSTPLTAQHL